MIRQAILGLLCHFLVSFTLAAQTIGSGGAMLRKVTRLERAPEPAGGLIPYRHGNLWGYADTTGRIIITPTFEEEPEFFIRGFGQVNTHGPRKDQITDRRFKPTFSHYDERPSQYVFINSRGEMLRATKDQVVVFEADSSLHIVDRKSRIFKPAVFRFVYSQQGLPLMESDLVTHRGGGSIEYIVPLGELRGLAYLKQNLPAKAYGLASQLLRTALVDENGKRLTAFKYANIHPFHNGLARFELTGQTEGHWGLLNRHGQEVLPGVHSMIVDAEHNRILVNKGYGPKAVCSLLDTLGRVVRAEQPGGMYWAIPGQLIIFTTATGQRLLDRDGNPLLNGREFARIDGLNLHVLKMTCALGQIGLLSSELQWLVPCQVQQFYSTPELLFTYEKPTYQFVVRGKKHGVISLRDGHDIVAFNYDTIYSSLGAHFFSARRNGRNYVLNQVGKEIGQGQITYRMGQRNGNRSRAETNCLDLIVAPVIQGNQVIFLDSLGRKLSPWLKHNPAVFGCQHFFNACTGVSILSSCWPNKSGVVAKDGQLVISAIYQSINYTDGLYLAKNETFIVFDDQGNTIKFPGVDHTELLTYGWAMNSKALVNKKGQLYLPPPGSTWEFQLRIGPYFEAYPFEFGVWKSSLGYVTRSGRQLWEN